MKRDMDRINEGQWTDRICAKTYLLNLVKQFGGD